MSYWSVRICYYYQSVQKTMCQNWPIEHYRRFNIVLVDQICPKTNNSKAGLLLNTPDCLCRTSYCYSTDWRWETHYKSWIESNWQCLYSISIRTDTQYCCWSYWLYSYVELSKCGISNLLGVLICLTFEKRKKTLKHDQILT